MAKLYNALSTSCGSNSGSHFPHNFGSGSLSSSSHSDEDYMPMDFMALMSDQMEIYGDINGLGDLPSIESDVAKMTQMTSYDFGPICNFLDDLDIKPEIRNGDCMWSAGVNGGGNNSNNNNSHNMSTDGINSAASSYNDCGAMPPAILTGSTPLLAAETAATATTTIVTVPANESKNSVTTVVANTQKFLRQQQQQQTKQNQQSNSKSAITVAPFAAANKLLTPEQYFPPGASLLRKSLKHERQQLKNNATTTSTSTRNSGNLILRPDTPQSMFDEVPPEFRHNVDLRACVMGSNNISLTSAGDHLIIDHLSRELANTSKQRIDLPYPVDSQISDVLDVISQQSSSSSCSNSSSASSSSSLLITPPATQSSDCDSDDGECSLVDSSCGDSSSSFVDGNNNQLMRHISEHSYTRCNDDMAPTLETPSDSDEEIDVVSLNDKKLPTNPSDKDRRVLQSKVAHKFSNRIVQTKNGVRIVPRRRGSYKLPCTPASSSPVKSVANSRYPSPSSTPIGWNFGSSNNSSSSAANSLLRLDSSSSSNVMLNANGGGGGDNWWPCPAEPAGLKETGKARKRYYVQPSGGVNSAAAVLGDVAGANKKYRCKKASLTTLPASSGSSSCSSSSGASSLSGNALISTYNAPHGNGNGNGSTNAAILKRQHSLDEADTIEKRNLHNDMERQRRIGLKNLFEALKKQIPSIKDKERAPKVNILREAAKLCENLTVRTDDLEMEQKKLLKQQKRRAKFLERLRRQRQQASE